MHRGLIVTLGIVGTLILLCVCGYLYMQHRATQFMNKELRKAVKPYVANPDSVTLTNMPIQIAPGRVRVPEIVIEGKDVDMPKSVSVTNARVAICDVEFDISGKAKKVTHVGEGSYDITFSTQDLTDFIHRQRAISLGPAQLVPETVTLSLSQTDGVGVTGQVADRHSGQQAPLVARGRLVQNAGGEIVFQPDEITVAGQSRLANLPPTLPTHLDEMLPQTMRGKVDRVTVADGFITFAGRFDGAAILKKE